MNSGQAVRFMFNAELLQARMEILKFSPAALVLSIPSGWPGQPVKDPFCQQAFKGKRWGTQI